MVSQRDNRERRSNNLTMLEAATKVLQDASQPLHYREIWRRIESRGIVNSRGRTPEQTLNSRLSVDIARNGSASRFRRTDPGIYGLASSSEHSQHAEPITQPLANAAARSLSFTDAAQRVLDQFGSRQPMHYRKITELALQHNFIVTQGKTPEATMYAQILSEIRRSSKRGERPRFVQHGKGLISLSRWRPKGLAFEIEQHNRSVRRQYLDEIKEMPPNEFEELIGRLLTALGFSQVAATPLNRDGGIDVRGTLVVGDVIRTSMAVQVKRWQANVQAPTVQQVRGSLGTHEQGLIITTSDFSNGARAEAQRSTAVPVGLMDGEQLVNLLIENDIGVHRATHDIIELDKSHQEGD
jgi:restriction system protein